MKTLKVCGWAVIFTVTFLLVACASHTPKVTDIDDMSGPDAYITQPTEQETLELRKNELAINQAWLNEREKQVTEREDKVALRENALAINEAWLNELNKQMTEREDKVDLHENALVINDAWQNEREMQLTRREADVGLRENALAINEAWQDEREMQVTRREADVGLRENALAINEAWQNEREARLTDQAKELDQTLMAATGSPETKLVAGHCYASVFIPAQYKTVAVTKPVELPTGEDFPVRYQTVTEQVKTADEHYAWKEILCANSITEDRIKEVQQSLMLSGYDPGPIDGVFGKQTMAAMNDFQRDFNLTVANHLTIETVMALDASH